MVFNTKVFNKQLYINATILFSIIVLLFKFNKSTIQQKSTITTKYSVQYVNYAEKYEFNISFVETNERASEIDLKQLCALESAARHNPNAKIYLYTVCNKLNINYVTQYYENIEMVLIDLNTVFIGTPLESWWKRDKLNKVHKHKRILHLSDALRLLLVWQNGGLYLDLDFYTLDTYEDLIQHESLCLYKSGEKIVFSSGFLIGHKHSRYIFGAMEYYAKFYSQNSLADNGPKLMHRYTMNYCKLKWGQEREILLVGDKSTSNPVRTFTFDFPESNPCKVYLLPSYVVFPYFWKESHKLFEPNGKISVNRYLYSRAVHTSTTQSQDLGIGQTTSQIDFICRFNCPRTYKRMIDQ